MSEPSTEQTESYLRLLSEHERWLAGYVFSLVPHAADGEDLLQEVKLTLWRQFARFELGTNFKAWARTIATHAVLNYRRAVKKRAAPLVEDAFIEAVAAEVEQQSAHLEARTEALRWCVDKLPQNQRQVVSWRYFDDSTVEEIGQRLGKSAEAVYQMLSRIRSALNECIERRLSA
jgi:RNA polymerase sigma-70 factor, ECF subfamily